MKKNTTLVLVTFSLLFLSMLVPQSSQASINAVGITCPTEVRIGNMISCKASGLTVGNNYRTDAVHSDGNVTRILTADTSVGYFRFTFTTADSDGLVPVSINAASATGGYAQINNPTDNTSTYDTALVNLVNPGEDIPSSFFQNLLAPILIIGIFVLLMAAFFIKRRK